jgi:hypothetical protein
MPLPNVGDLISGPVPTGIAPATCTSPPVAATSAATHDARHGYARWVGNKLEFVALSTGVLNYWYIPQAPAGHAHFCVVPCGAGPEAYVVSDNYGGCEYHEAYNAGLNILAFFHVYRGGGGVAQYQLSNGWVQRSVIRSQVIAQTVGSNWSISCINPAVNPPTVTSKFIRVGLAPALTVQAEDNGTTPYPPTGLGGLARAMINRLF